jgi:hypothetical protein
MREYLSHDPARFGVFSSEELDKLDSLMQRAIEELALTDHGERNELAARVFTLYSLGGRSLDQIYEIAVRLHVHGATPGGRLNPYKFR